MMPKAQTWRRRKEKFDSNIEEGKDDEKDKIICMSQLMKSKGEVAKHMAPSEIGLQFWQQARKSTKKTCSSCDAGTT